MSHPCSNKARSLVGNGDDGLARAAGGRPQLLALLPGSLCCSSGFIMGIVAVEFLYALVLFGVMSTRRPEPPSEVVDAPAIAELAPARPAAPAIEPTPAPPPQEPKVVAKVEEKKDVAAKETPKATAPPAPAEASTASNTTVADKPKPDVATTSAKPAAPPAPPTQTIAVATTSAPKPSPTEAVAVGSSTLEPLGDLIDPLQDCRIQRESRKGMCVQIPATLHAFDPDHSIADAPRAVTDISGDFTAQVKVSGSIKPGTTPFPQLPFTFQGAGILIWQDANNYVRLERAAGYYGERGLVHHVLVESRNEGRPGRGAFIPVRDGAITLRVERRGGEFNCTYTSDGKNWLPVKKLSLTMAPKLTVGVSATNAAPRPFSAKFEDFSLNKQQPKAG